MRPAPVPPRAAGLAATSTRWPTRTTASCWAWSAWTTSCLAARWVLGGCTSAGAHPLPACPKPCPCPGRPALHGWWRPARRRMAGGGVLRGEERRRLVPALPVLFAPRGWPACDPAPCTPAPHAAAGADARVPQHRQPGGLPAACCGLCACPSNCPSAALLHPAPLLPALCLPRACRAPLALLRAHASRSWFPLRTASPSRSARTPS